MLMGDREAPRLADAVVFFDVPTRTSDGQMIQQGKVIETEHLNQAGRGLFCFFQFQPTVELFLRQARSAINTGYAMIG